MHREWLLVLGLWGCSSSAPPAVADTGTPQDLAPDVESTDVVTDAAVADADAVVDVPTGDVQRICPVVARAGERCGELEGLVCTGTRVCTQCGVSAYEYFEQQCVCMTGVWQCGGHGDCGPTARCGYFSDPTCMAPHPCGDSGVDGGADGGIDAAADASDDVEVFVDERVGE